MSGEPMLIQVDDVVRPATPEERYEIEQIRAESAAQVERLAAIQAARASAVGKLARLGLSEEEIAALLGSQS